MNDLQIRLATNADGDRIGELCRQRGFIWQNWSPDWSQVWPYWLVAECGDRVVGAIQTCPGRPVGRLEFCVWETELAKEDRKAVMCELLYAGCAALRAYGAGAMSSIIPDETEGWKKYLDEIGFHTSTQAHGELVIRRI